jgi:predicted dehydrogenase
MLESVDGRRHLEQAKPVIKARKPLFIDKPAAASLRDVTEIFRLAKQHQVPCFSSSSNRFATAIQEVKNSKGDVAKGLAYDVFGISQSIPHHPTLYFYDIHGVEMLYTMMGRGCVSVSRVQTPHCEQITAVWKDGRIGTYRGIRGNAALGFGVTIYETKAVRHLDVAGEDEGIVRAIVNFFKTGTPPVDAEDTLEIFAFMDAAEISRQRGGAPVSIAEILPKMQSETATPMTE